MKPKLLIFELRMIGDAIMSLPFVRAAAASFEVWVCCAPGCVAVFETALPKERIIAWQPPWLVESGKYAWRRWRESGVGDLVRRVRGVRADMAVSVWADARTHILMALSGARERVGFPMVAVNHYAHHLAWRRRQLVVGGVLNAVAGVALGRRLLTRKLLRTDYRQHHVENWRQLAEALDLAWDARVPWFAAGTAGVSADLSGLVARARAAGRAVWVVHPGGRVPEQRWPLAGFARVVREVLLPAGVLVVVVKPPEVDFGTEWETLAPVVRPGNLGELFGVVSLADVVLCNDTGVAHVAAGLGKRVVGIFTASEPDWFAPWGSREYVVRQAVCAFHPCLGRCVMPTVICREAVTVELVAARVRQMLTERG